MAILVRIHPELASREHLYLETLDENGNAAYKAVLEQTHREYFERLSAAEDDSDPRYQQLEIPLGEPAEPKTKQ